MSEYTRLEKSRNARLWVTQVVIPLAVLGFGIMQNQDAKDGITKAATKIKNKITSKIKI